MDSAQRIANDLHQSGTVTIELIERLSIVNMHFTATPEGGAELTAAVPVEL
jgi:hypothetical protein